MLKLLGSSKTTMLVPMLLSVFALRGRAQSLSLDQAIKESLEQSPKLQKAASAKEEAEWKRVESFSGHMPTISAGVSYLTDKKYMLTDIQLPGAPTASHIPQIVPTANYSLNLQLPLFDGFATTHRYYAARELEASASDELSWMRFQHTREVTLAFFKALALASLKEVAEQSSKTLGDHLKDTRLFKASGLSTNYDVLKVEAQVSESQTEVLNSQDNADLARLKLNELLGKDEDSRSLSGSLLVPDEGWVSSLQNQNSTRSDITALHHKVEASQYQQKAAGRYLVPRISLFGQYQDYNNQSDRYDFQHADFREAYQVGFLLSWNLFDGFASVAKSHEAIEQKYQAEKSLRMTELKSKQDVEWWRRKLIYFCKVYKARLNDVLKSTETLRLAREGRRAGTRTNTDLLDAETELFKAKANVINAQIGAIEALINLELATGQELLPVARQNQGDHS